jgi:zinc transport system ATP-binding protein
MLMTDGPVLEAHDLAVTLAGRPIIRDLDVALQPGEVVALMGTNGSGKSTLVKALLGLLPRSGEVRLFGTPLGSFRDWRRLGYVPQRSTIAVGVPSTVREVVASGRIAHRRPFLPARQADRDAVDRAIAAVGLAERAQHTIGTLSGGQQQRVLVARTLATEPELLLLDEPTAGVDMVSQQAIADTLAGLTAHGATILVVLHELGPFAPLVQRTLVMRQGRLVYDGPPDLAGVDDHDHHHRLPTAPVPEVRVPLDHLGPRVERGDA